MRRFRVVVEVEVVASDEAAARALVDETVDSGPWTDEEGSWVEGFTVVAPAVVCSVQPGARSHPAVPGARHLVALGE